MNLCTNADHAMCDTGGIPEVSLADVSIDSTLAALKLDLIPGDSLHRIKQTDHRRKGQKNGHQKVYPEAHDNGYPGQDH